MYVWLRVHALNSRLLWQIYKPGYKPIYDSFTFVMWDSFRKTYTQYRNCWCRGNVRRQG